MACQFAQDTDPRFPLLYFTIDSAILAGVVAVLTLVGWDGFWQRRIQLTAMVGVLVSAIVFAAVIAPATPTGTWIQPHDDLAVRVATVLFHAVAPVLVTMGYLIGPQRQSLRTSLRWSYLWPLTYLGGLAVLAAVVGPGVIPYPSLRPDVMGWPTVLGACLAVTGLIAVLVIGLHVLGRAVARRMTASDTRPTEVP